MRKGELCYYTYRRMSEDYLFSPELISERLSNCCNFPRRSKIESPSVSIIAKVFHFRYGVHAYTRTKQLLGFLKLSLILKQCTICHSSNQFTYSCSCIEKRGGGTFTPAVSSFRSRSFDVSLERGKQGKRGM